MEIYRLTSGQAFAEIIPLGATIHRIVVPDRSGIPGDVVLHADDPETRYPMRAMTIGRFANRIADGRFSIDGAATQLERNDGKNTLHSASGNYGNRMFTAERLADNAVRMTLREEGEGGWNGGADMAVTFTFSEAGGAYALSLHYELTPDEDSPVNLTNHAYFNLAAGGDILDHVLWLDADRFTPKGDKGLPVGGFADVGGTPFDFRTPRTFREAYESAKPGDFRFAGAFDDNYELRGEGLRLFARVSEPTCGRVLEAYTDMPGVQLFTPVFPFAPKFCGFCLETQFFPNSINCPEYRSPLVRAGDTFTSDTVFRFLCE